jgi:hypothetical protein
MNVSPRGVDQGRFTERLDKVPDHPFFEHP